MSYLFNLFTSHDCNFICCFTSFSQHFWNVYSVIILRHFIFCLLEYFLCFYITITWLFYLQHHVHCLQIYGIRTIYMLLREMCIVPSTTAIFFNNNKHCICSTGIFSCTQCVEIINVCYSGQLARACFCHTPDDVL